MQYGKERPSSWVVSVTNMENLLNLSYFLLRKMGSPQKNIKHSNPFNRSGLASLDDLRKEYWKESFCKLEQDQHDFLSKEKDFRSSEYEWPRDALHCWSHVWEYPYVYHHLKEFKTNFNNNVRLNIVD